MGFIRVLIEFLVIELESRPVCSAYAKAPETSSYIALGIYYDFLVCYKEISEVNSNHVEKH